MILGQGTPTNCLFVKDLTTGGTSPIYTLAIAGTPLTAGDTVNFNATLPAAPPNALNVVFQTSNSGLTDSVSAYILGNGNVLDCLSGTATWVACGGSGGSNITVNGGSALTSPVNLQNGTSGNVINFSNPSGSNVQATIQNASVTSAMLAAVVSGASCTLCNITVNNEGQVTALGSSSAGSGTAEQVINLNTTTVTTNTNTTSLQNLMSYTFAAGKLNTAGLLFKMTATGTQQTPNSGTNFNLVFQATSVAIPSPTSQVEVGFFSAALVYWSQQFLCYVGTAGASGSITCQGISNFSNSPPNNQNIGPTVSFTISPIDLTAAETFQWQNGWTAASASNVTTQNSLLIEILNAANSGGGLSGAGTPGTIPEWVTSSSLGNSPIVDGGATGITITNPATGLFGVQTSGGATNDGALQIGGASASSSITYLGNVPISSFDSGLSAGCEFQNGTLNCAASTNSGSGGFSKFTLTGVPTGAGSAAGSFTWEIIDSNGFGISAVAPGSTAPARVVGIDVILPSGAFFNIIGGGTDVFDIDSSGNFIQNGGHGYFNSYTDFLASTPANPTSGIVGRLYYNSTTALMACLTSTGASCMPSGGGGGNVTTSGSPASGNLTEFSGATSITNGNLSGDVTTSNTLATTVVALRNATLPTIAAATGLLYDTAGTLSLPGTLPTAAEPAHTGDATNSAAFSHDSGGLTKCSTAHDCRIDWLALRHGWNLEPAWHIAHGCIPSSDWRHHNPWRFTRDDAGHGQFGSGFFYLYKPDGQRQRIGDRGVDRFVRRIAAANHAGRHAL